MSAELYEFPRGIFHTAVLTDSAQRVGPIGGSLLIRSVLFQGGASASVVVFANEGAGVTYFKVPLAIAEMVNLPSFSLRATGGGVAGGLNIYTEATEGDVFCTIFYHSTRLQT